MTNTQRNYVLAFQRDVI